MAQKECASDSPTWLLRHLSCSLAVDRRHHISPLPQGPRGPRGGSSPVSWLPSEKVMVQQSRSEVRLLAMEPHHFCCTLFLRSEAPDSRPHIMEGATHGHKYQKWESTGPSQWLPITAPYPLNPGSTLSSPTHKHISLIPVPVPLLLTYFTPLSNSFTNSKPDNNSRGSSNSTYSMKLSLITLYYSPLLHVL